MSHHSSHALHPNHAPDDAVIRHDGYRWFFLVGIIAVVFAYVLRTIDDGLSNSDRERKLGEILHELRTAQSQMGSRVSDERQTSPYLFVAPAVHGSSSHSAH